MYINFDGCIQRIGIRVAVWRGDPPVRAEELFRCSGELNNWAERTNIKCMPSAQAAAARLYIVQRYTERRVRARMRFMRRRERGSRRLAKAARNLAFS